jgi:hypothetical protein
VRGVDEGLYRSAKALASLNGVLLGKVVNRLCVNGLSELRHYYLNRDLK